MHYKGCYYAETWTKYKYKYKAPHRKASEEGLQEGRRCRTLWDWMWFGHCCCLMRQGGILLLLGREQSRSPRRSCLGWKMGLSTILWSLVLRRLTWTEMERSGRPDQVGQLVVEGLGELSLWGGRWPRTCSCCSCSRRGAPSWCASEVLPSLSHFVKNQPKTPEQQYLPVSTFLKSAAL